MIKKVIVVNNELTLYPPSLDDAEALYTIIDNQRAILEKWMTWLMPLKTLEDVKVYLFDAIRFFEGGQRLTFFIKKETLIIGSVTFTKVDKKHRKGEFGYWLHKDYTRQGIMLEAIPELINYGFNDLDLNKLEIRVDEKNERSRKLAMNLGFQLEGVLRQDFLHQNEFQNSAVYGLLRSEWKKNMR